MLLLFAHLVSPTPPQPSECLTRKDTSMFIAVAAWSTAALWCPEESGFWARLCGGTDASLTESHHGLLTGFPVVIFMMLDFCPNSRTFCAQPSPGGSSIVSAWLSRYHTHRKPLTALRLVEYSRNSLCACLLDSHCLRFLFCCYCVLLLLIYFCLFMSISPHALIFVVSPSPIFSLTSPWISLSCNKTGLACWSVFTPSS